MAAGHYLRSYRYVPVLQAVLRDGRTLLYSGGADHHGAAGFRRRRQPQHLGYFFRLVPDVRLHVLADGDERGVRQNAAVDPVLLSQRTGCAAVDRNGTYRSQGSQEERCHHHADRAEPRHHRRLSGAYLPRCADLYGGANDGLPCCADRRQEHCRRKNRRADADQIRRQARQQARQRRTLLWRHQHSQHLCRQQTFRAAVRQLTSSD